MTGGTFFDWYSALLSSFYLSSGVCFSFSLLVRKQKTLDDDVNLSLFLSIIGGWLPWNIPLFNGSLDELLPWCMWIPLLVWEWHCKFICRKIIPLKTHLPVFLKKSCHLSMCVPLALARSPPLRFGVWNRPHSMELRPLPGLHWLLLCPVGGSIVATKDGMCWKM